VASGFRDSRIQSFLEFVSECGEDPATIMRRYPLVPPPSTKKKARAKRQRSASSAFTPPPAAPSSSILASLDEASAAQRRAVDAASPVPLLMADMAAACAPLP
jgi:hypothetical protein